jgi:hypothetical protein
MKVLQEDVPGMFDVLFGVDPLVEGFHAKLTAKERNHRFGSAEQALSVLTPYLNTIRAQYPSLVADCIRDPVGMKQRLVREHAEAEMGRALALVQRHGPIHAAALALENAVHIDPSFSIAQQRLGEQAGMGGIGGHLRHRELCSGAEPGDERGRQRTRAAILLPATVEQRRQHRVGPAIKRANALGAA